jgi:diaminohydroxyphosphoribosylaminopyrimidine deaminase / 5-amino-6-(5-phosphoribosylamino)uracil reductase
MKQKELYIKRCFDLAKLGKGKVSPNPLVGAVIVYNNRIIGEGFHAAYGKAHAEVNAIASVKKEDRKLLEKATIYISLEPCCIHGNTPPCTDLIIRHKIPKVFFSSIDNTPEVNGKSIKLLESAGRTVNYGILQTEGDQLLRFRNTFVTQKRPFIILKFAQSQDGFMSKKGESTWLSNSISKRLVHKWRNETDAILIGTNTAQIDNPKLTNRLYFGSNPLRIILDKNLRLSEKLNIFDDSENTWIVTEKKKENPSFKNTTFVNLNFDKQLIFNLLEKLYDKKFNSLIVEGGAKLLGHFITLELWDEARVFIADRFLNDGIKAPILPNPPVAKYKIGSDQLYVFKYAD